MTIEERADWIEAKMQANCRSLDDHSCIEYGLALLCALAHLNYTDEQWEQAEILIQSN